jgi:hypothetical protein
MHVVSAWAGHSKPFITFDTYSHLLGGEDKCRKAGRGDLAACADMAPELAPDMQGLGVKWSHLLSVAHVWPTPQKANGR